MESVIFNFFREVYIETINDLRQSDKPAFLKGCFFVFYIGIALLLLSFIIYVTIIFSPISILTLFVFIGLIELLTYLGRKFEKDS